MRIVKIEDLKGGEVLERAIITHDFQSLLSEGTTLKKEYIEKLKELGIESVYVQDEIKIPVEEISILREDVENSFREKVQNILEKHTYQHNTELIELSKTADSIISNILEEEKVVERIYDIKERSADIYEHSISVCSLAILIAIKLKLDKEEIHDIGVGCLLHDMGLRYLTINYKDQNLDELSDLELSEYKKHPVYGYSSLQGENWISERSKQTILYHHERLDGSGYPLKAKALTIYSKIISVCDIFDEMICGIGCRQIKVYEAVEYLKTFKGTKYDAEIVDLFLDFTAVYPVGTMVLLNTGETGIIIRQNAHFPERPVLRVTKDKNGKEITNEIKIDLLEKHSTFINEVLN